MASIRHRGISLPANQNEHGLVRHVEDEQHFHKTELSNGLRIISERIPGVHSLAIGMWIHAGSVYESPAENGISHFVEHAVFKGTQRRKTHQIAQYLESVGGYVNAFTTKEHTCYYARVMNTHLERAVDLLTDIIFHPAFPEREIEKEKQVILEEMRASDDEPEELIHDEFEKLLFAPHPLGNLIIGTEASVSSLKKKDLHTFCDRFHVPSKMLITAAGDVDHDALVRLMEASVGSNGRTSIEKKFTKPSQKKSQSLLLMKPTQQAHVCLGTQTQGTHTPDRFAMVVLNTLLGDGMSSRLFQLVRERYGLAYSVYSFLALMKDAGMFGVYVGTEEEQADRCIDLIRSEITSIRVKGISQRELNRAKEQVKGGLLLSMESTSDRMMHIARNELYFEKYVPLSATIARIDAVTIDELKTVAASLCDVDRYSMAMIRPDEKSSVKSET